MMAGPASQFIIAFLIITVSTFISFLIAPFVALRKGFAPYYWMFACGPIGLFVILCTPGLNTTTTPEEYERLEQRTNMIGATLSGVALFLFFAAVGFVFVGI